MEKKAYVRPDMETIEMEVASIIAISKGEEMGDSQMSKRKYYQQYQYEENEWECPFSKQTDSEE